MLERVQTHEQLQCLLWLASHSDSIVSAKLVAQLIGASDVASVDAALRALVDAELAVFASPSHNRFRFGPASAELRRQVDLLLSLYVQHPADVLCVLANNAVDRIRHAAAHVFTARTRSSPPSGELKSDHAETEADPRKSREHSQ